MPSRDVFRLLHEIRTADGKQFIAAAREFYQAANIHDRDFTIRFYDEFELEIGRIKRRLDIDSVPISRVLGEIFEILKPPE